MSLSANSSKKNNKVDSLISLNKLNTGNSKKELSGTSTEKESFDPEEIIFALDIGTRSVVGIVGIQEKDKFRIISVEVLEHKNREMQDGQIHDIKQVVEIVSRVKERLEKKMGFTLTKVAIAAAGRVLKTCEVKVCREIDQSQEISKDLVNSIEIEGIQLAQLKLNEEIDKTSENNYYCVGYSIINYYLNDFTITTLIGHKGLKIGVDILATFLPHIVIDSLYTVTSKVGLEVISLTLEPIAAINVTIPKDLRLLNLALVDIGAGTSDIAITKGGTVIAYAMVPMAGDEISEKISEHYLVDFNTSEKIKIALSSTKENINFIDIIGRKQAVNVEDVLAVINPILKILAETITGKILEYNHKAPNAVFLIGGGCQIPGLTDIISDCLKLPKDRVVVRGREVIQNIRFSGRKFAGPEAITPFGIAVTAQMQRGNDFLTVSINNRKIRLFNSKRLSVGDALILIGYNPNQLIGRSGKSIAFEINGVKRVARGDFGNAAQIFVNGVAANIETYLHSNDEIKVIPAEDGLNAEVLVSQLVKDITKGKIILNNDTVEFYTKVQINDKTSNGKEKIANGDKIKVSEIRTLNDLINLYEIDRDYYEVLVNGNSVGNDYLLQENDDIQYSLAKEVRLNNASEVLVEEKLNENTIEKQDHQDIYSRVSSKNSKDFSISVVINGKTTLLSGGKSKYIFVDVFNYINFDLSKPAGNMVLKLNGNQASFTDEIKHNDVIEIFWDKCN